MRLTVLGGAGAFPTPAQGCSGYVVEHDGFVLLIDPGYATVQRLLTGWAPAAVDAVLVTHGHPDHCADLHPLLRARAFADDPPPPLPLYAPTGALDALLALDRPQALAGAYTIHGVGPGDRWSLGPFTIDTVLLPHILPNLGVRVTGPGASLMYTGDSGPSPALVELAAGVDLLLAEATHLEHVPPPMTGLLSTAADAGAQAAQAGVRRLMLTHLWPGTDPAEAVALAARAFTGPIEVALPGTTYEGRA